MNTVETKMILSADDSKRKIRRMAFEIAERNLACGELIVAGIAGNGVVVAKNVMEELQQILQCSIRFVTINIDKTNPLQVSVDADMNFEGKHIIVVDDVANTGKVLLYALKPLLQFQTSSIQTLVLVERSHKLFPVQTDYVGLSVATTLQEHITVETAGGKITGAWLY